MGLFDSFRQKNEFKKRSIPGEALPEKQHFSREEGSRPMRIRRPRSFADVEEIIDRFKDNLTVIVYVNELSDSTATRVTDMLSGAIYALGGGMALLQKDMYIFTPDGVDQK